MESCQTPFPNPNRARSMRRIDCWKARTIKNFACYLLPFAISPLAFSSSKESRCAFVILWMMVYWMLEPVNITVTALLPVPLMPLLGILDTGEVASNYMKEMLLMFIGGLGVAIAIQHCHLHERIALKILLTFGAETKWLMMGFMLTTMFLSMWISNTTTTAMMLPILEAVMGGLQRRSKGEDVEMEQKLLTLHKTLLLSVAYSATCGGKGTITGASPNMVFQVYVKEFYPDSHEITYASWMAYNIPGMLLCVFAAWLLLQFFYEPCWRLESEERRIRIEALIDSRYKQLGRMTFHEIAILTLFLLMLFLWVFREPKFVTGWATRLASGKNVGNSVPAIAILILMFLLPSEPWKLHKSPPLLRWKTVQEKLPWGSVILLGGGYALNDGAKKSGLTILMGNEMSKLFFLPTSVVLAILCLLTTFATEFLSNSTITSLMVPLVNRMAVIHRINPLYLMLPVTILASFSFMLPVATGPNALVFSTGILKLSDMVKPGIIMNILSCALQVFMANTYGVYLFNLDTVPDWANNTMTNITAILEKASNVR